jgi:two-component system NarL family sensor kinase
VADTVVQDCAVQEPARPRRRARHAEMQRPVRRPVRHRRPQRLDVEAPARPLRTGVALLQFAVAGLLALIVLALLGWSALRSATEHQTVLQAAELTSLEAQVVIEPLLTDGVVSGDPAALATLDRAVHDRVLSSRVVRVKLWTASGRVVYSDDSRLIGRVFSLEADDRTALRTGRVAADVSDLSAAENEFERLPGGDHRLVQVYARVRARDGRPLLFEMYLPSRRIEATARSLSRSVMPAFLPALLALELLQLPLAWRLVRRIKHAQREREALYTYTLEARDQERRRIARDLHDGVVQSLAGVSFSLSAVGERLASGDIEGCATQVRSAAHATRGNLSELRTLIGDIYPPTLNEVGLPAALEELLGEVATQGVAVRLDSPRSLELHPEIAGALYRGAREALRNVVVHSGAATAVVSLERTRSLVRLVVRDDGVGLPADEAADAHRHFGLRLLAQMADQAGGRLTLTNQPLGGAMFLLELPT